MTDQERIQKTFDKLHASPGLLTEVLAMTKKEHTVTRSKRHFTLKAAAIAAVLVLIIAFCSTAYALDLGGIQRTVQVWIHGDQTDAVFKVENGSYTLEYKDSDGKDIHMYGGGVAFNEDGSERPVTEEELWEEINAPDVSYEENGRVYVYYRDQKMDITDKFEDGICYVQLQTGDETKYMTVKYQKGYAMSPHGYIQPWMFNTSEEKQLASLNK